MVTIKSKKEIELMKDVCKIVAEFYEQLEKKVRPGVSTYELDQEAEKIMRSLGAIPAQIGYDPGIRGVPKFPASTCISVNDEVIHGIPHKNHIIKDGDIVSVDTVALKNGFHGDAARTFMVGNVSPEAKFAKPGFRIGDISHAVGEYVKSQGFSVLKEFQGHGIGREMHEDPGIPNYGKAGKGIRIEPGMTLCIEPMVIQGKPDIWELDDGWTIVTDDGSWAAHYENTILITENEPKILTIK